MFMRFLMTKIGFAAILALVLIGSAIAIKMRASSSRETDLQQKIGLIAETSLKDALKNATTTAENPLDILNGSSTASEPSDIANASSSAIADDTTATDRFSRDLFARYIAAKQNGQAIDAATQQEIANTVLSTDYSKEPALLTTADLTIASNSSLSAIKAYGNALGDALSAPPVAGDNELVILERDRNSGITDADAATLTRIMQRYQKMAKAMVNMKVPSGAAEAHLDILNGIDLLSNATEGILAITDDPIGSLTKIKHYEDGVNLIAAGSLGLRDYFKSKNIAYSANESGYGFTR